MEWSEEEEDDDGECLLLLLCEYFDLFDLLSFLWESEENLEEEEDDDLCLLLFDLCLFLDKSLLLGLEDVCLLAETQVLLGGAMITLAEMPTLNVAYQEYERHFSGIWGHFQEWHVFHNKCCKYVTKCTYTTSILPSTVPYSSLP